MLLRLPLSTNTFPLPLPTNGPPEGFGFEGRSISQTSATTVAFSTGLDQRDQIDGRRFCVVCGYADGVIQRCHIIPRVEDLTSTVKSVEHDPRNGLSLCPTHHNYFDQYYFFIRFVPSTRRFVFINYSNIQNDWLSPYHGRAIVLDPDHRHAPFPGLFLIHEQRVRGYWPFSPPPVIPGEIPSPAWFPGLLATPGEQMSTGEQDQPGASSRNAASQGGRGPDVSANPAPGNTRQAQFRTSRLKMFLKRFGIGKTVAGKAPTVGITI